MSWQNSKKMMDFHLPHVASKKKVITLKLIHGQNDSPAKHLYSKFFTATITHSEELASILSPTEVLF